jgi:hypothetical protein
MNFEVVSLTLNTSLPPNTALATTGHRPMGKICKGKQRCDLYGITLKKLAALLEHYQ